MKSKSQFTTRRVLVLIWLSIAAFFTGLSIGLLAYIVISAITLFITYRFYFSDRVKKKGLLVTLNIFTIALSILFAAFYIGRIQKIDTLDDSSFVKFILILAVVPICITGLFSLSAIMKANQKSIVSQPNDSVNAEHQTEND